MGAGSSGMQLAVKNNSVGPETVIHNKAFNDSTFVTPERNFNSSEEIRSSVVKKRIPLRNFAKASQLVTKSKNMGTEILLNYHSIVVKNNQCILTSESGIYNLNRMLVQCLSDGAPLNIKMMLDIAG